MITADRKGPKLYRFLRGGITVHTAILRLFLVGQEKYMLYFLLGLCYTARIFTLDFLDEPLGRRNMPLFDSNTVFYRAYCRVGT